MASASVLQRLHQRASQAEEMIAMLKTQIDSLRDGAVTSASRPEEERLRIENAQLRGEVEKLKLQFALTEIRNGVKQIPLPSKKTVASVACSADANDAKPAVAKESVQTEEKPQQKGDSAKNKTEKKGKGQAQEGSEPKPKKTKGGDKKVAAPEPENIDVSRLDLRVGKIVAVKKHPDADSLYVEEVDLGEGKTRTIVSGLVKHVPIEQMQDRLAIFMCNLKPAKMRGILSEGMIMCANSPAGIEILVTPAGSEIGDRVTTKEYPGTPDVLLNPKKKIWEAVKPDLRTDANKVATYKGAQLLIEGKGIIVSPTQADAQIS